MTQENVANTSRAWLLNFGQGLQAAVGYHEMWQILMAPRLFEVPYTPSYCNEILVLQENILPVLDLSARLIGHKKMTSLTKPIVGIVIYKEDPNHLAHYGCLHLTDLPQSIYVSDNQACDLPEEESYWAPLVLSCFSHEERVVPIIDLAYLFSEEFYSSPLNPLSIQDSDLQHDQDDKI